MWEIISLGFSAECKSHNGGFDVAIKNDWRMLKTEGLKHALFWMQRIPQRRQNKGAGVGVELHVMRGILAIIRRK